MCKHQYFVFCNSYTDQSRVAVSMNHFVFMYAPMQFVSPTGNFIKKAI